MYQAWACLEMRGENYEKARALISEALTRDKKAGSGSMEGKVKDVLAAIKIQTNKGIGGKIGVEADNNHRPPSNQKSDEKDTGKELNQNGSSQLS
jgi:hypothetical protein